MMPTSITPDTFITSFPAQPPRIEGEPTYASLARAKKLLKGNAASIPSNRGGGTNGYLGLTVTVAVYATIDDTAFVIPPYPGAQPEIPNGTSVANTRIIVRIHEEATREWREYTNIHLTLKSN